MKIYRVVEQVTPKSSPVLWLGRFETREEAQRVIAVCNAAKSHAIRIVEESVPTTKAFLVLRRYADEANDLVVCGYTSIDHASEHVRQANLAADDYGKLVKLDPALTVEQFHKLGPVEYLTQEIDILDAVPSVPAQPDAAAIAGNPHNS